MRIWQLGFNKCGSTSLCTLFNRIGLPSVHSNRLGKLIARVHKQDPTKSIDDVLSSIDTSELSDVARPASEIVGFFDGEYYQHYEWLSQDNASDRFILNVRDIEDWATSVMTHVLRNRICPELDPYMWRDFDSRREKKRHSETVSDIKNYFGSSWQLLVIDVTRPGNHIKTICDWLRIESSVDKMPKENTCCTHIKQIYKAKVPSDCDCSP